MKNLKKTILISYLLITLGFTTSCDEESMNAFSCGLTQSQWDNYNSQLQELSNMYNSGQIEYYYYSSQWDTISNQMNQLEYSNPDCFY